MKISLTLSGGGVRAVAHLGAIKALEEKGYEIEAISGTSGGAMVALLYGHGGTIEEILSLVKSFSYKDLLHFDLSSPGTLSNIKESLREFLIDRKQEIPIEICATNLKTGEPEYFSGNLLEATIASSSIAGLFPPIKIGENNYIDGGHSDNLPTKNFCKRFSKNISINVNFFEQPKNMRAFEVWKAGFTIMLRSNMIHSRELSDIHIPLKRAGEFGLFDFKSINKLFIAGYEESLRYLQNYTRK